MGDVNDPHDNNNNNSSQSSTTTTTTTAGKKRTMKKISIETTTSAPSSSSGSSIGSSSSGSGNVGGSGEKSIVARAVVATPVIRRAGGGIWEYFVNRKREKTKERQQHQHRNHTTGIDDSTASTTTATSSWLVDTPTAMTLAAAASSSSSSMEDVESSSSLSQFTPYLHSWMNHAWQTVDSAKEWIRMLHTSSSSSSSNALFDDIIIMSNSDDYYDNSTSTQQQPPNENSIWTTMTMVSSFPSFLSSINPFLDKNDYDHHHRDNSPPAATTSTTSSSSASSSSSSSKARMSSTFLLSNNFASRFEWATRHRNPYQAVIGRGEVYYAEDDWSSYWLQLPHWLITNQLYYRYNDGMRGRIRRSSSSGSGSDKQSSNDSQNVDDNNNNIDGEGCVMAATEEQHKQRTRLRKHSRTSDASIQAVKDLLTLVRQQVVAMQELEEAQQIHRPEEEVATSSLFVQPMTPDISSAVHSSSLSATATSHHPPLAAGFGLASSLPITSPHDPKLLFHGESFDSEDNLVTMRSSPVRAPPRLFDEIGSTETVLHSEGKTIDKRQAIKAEMASLLAEGTLRAYRDLALDEATELRSALHHWTIRWERPFLGWLEAGPEVWFQVGDAGGEGYSPSSSSSSSSSSPQPPHLAAGKKVSQIQVVLARRCAVIGELQQHLWRASWQKGVAGWGMLGGGVGGEWTSVVGEFGGIDAPRSSSRAASYSTSSAQTQQTRDRNKQQQLIKIFKHSNFIGTNVSNLPGGSRCIDDALTKWCIDAMRVIRDQLYRVLPASQGATELPYAEHWPIEMKHFRGENVNNNEAHDLPSWARYASASSSTSDAAEISHASLAAAEAAGGNHVSSVIITDLGKMSEEVSAVLECIEVLLEQQRTRRLDWLRPPSRLRRNWYLIALGVPVGAYMMYTLTKEHGWIMLLNTLFSKTADICRDHVFEPLNSIYKELFTKSGRIDVTDKKARVDAIESLKRMIRSWLEEVFPKMPVEEMVERADKMDISLIEERMEESIKHLYELNSVVRMSLIEMQFIKKELLNALVQMDDLVGSNEINMRIAAMTPAVILLYAIRRSFQVLFYALFKVGKSKEEIYASFRQTVLDIERLLLMRDCPPSPPDPLDWGSTRPASNNGRGALESNIIVQKNHSQTLSAEDLGMLLLHIHEIRNILWESRRRFRDDELRNVNEDLAELAGERGPVSVAQQLQIISRMSRTYPFMKVISSGLPFPALRPGLG